MASLSTTRLNETFDVLRHPYRRFVLYYLTTETDDVGIDTIASAIAAWSESQTGLTRRNDPETIALALHHLHIPKLESAGIVSFRPNSDVLTLEKTDGLNRFLDETAPIDAYSLPVATD